MNNTLKGFFFSACFLISSFAQASFIEMTQNPGNADIGAKVYLPPNTSGFPTPFMDVNNAPAPQYTFWDTDDIRVASQYDLQAITESDLNGYQNGQDGQMLWEYLFATIDFSVQIWNSVVYDWAQIEADQNNGFEALNFASDDTLLNSGFLAAGDWIVYTYAEGVFQSSAQFHVRGIPEPGNLALLGLGLVLVGTRRLKRSTKSA